MSSQRNGVFPSSDPGLSSTGQLDRRLSSKSKYLLCVCMLNVIEKRLKVQSRQSALTQSVALLFTIAESITETTGKTGGRKQSHRVERDN